MLVFAVVERCDAQGLLFNVDFEHPILPLILDPGDVVPIANALPGWRGYIGEMPVDGIRYDDRAIDAADISIQDSLSPFLRPIQGSYSVLLKGSSMNTFEPKTAAIAQTALIPQNTRSLIFFSTSFSTFQVTFGGQFIPLLQVGAGTNFIVLGGDVSQFAGQVAELRFTVPPIRGGVLDNIQFSTQAIPEPVFWRLLACGTVLLGWHRWRRVASKRLP